MEPNTTLRRVRRPIISLIYYVITFVIFGYAIITMTENNNSYIYLSILFLILALNYIPSLFYKVVIYEDNLDIHTLFKTKRIDYADIIKVDYGTIGSDSARAKAIQLHLTHTKWIQSLPVKLFGAKERQKEFIYFLLGKNPSIEQGKLMGNFLNDESFFSITRKKNG